jgi:hypothetical protein
VTFPEQRIESPAAKPFARQGGALKKTSPSAPLGSEIAISRIGLPLRILRLASLRTTPTVIPSSPVRSSAIALARVRSWYDLGQKESASSTVA